MTHEAIGLFEEIRTLLAAPPAGAGAPGRARVEHTLTSGYALALALEAERERLARRLDASDAAEHDGLRERLAAAAAALTSLRTLLKPLRERARRLRVEESQAAAAEAL